MVVELGSCNVTWHSQLSDEEVKGMKRYQIIGTYPKLQLLAASAPIADSIVDDEHEWEDDERQSARLTS